MSFDQDLVDLDAISATCFSAVFSDICDAMGYRSQTVEPGIGHLAGRPGVLVGWARTAHSVAVPEPPGRHYGREIDFIDSLRSGDVVVARVDAPAAFWGELFSSAALGRGARGVVVDGLIRDQERIEDLEFAVFARGSRPTDSLGRISIAETDATIDCGGVEVRSGDLVVADRDGITIVPRQIASDAIDRATAKALTESQAKQLLLAGATLAETWSKYRVL